ncbi:MAG: hypothetical protein Ta2D_08250 [Rickettsiales bacterium]|nr:MAG: hypothetical protein Ta2D_08250 [Rickettsiales bacterium]
MTKELNIPCNFQGGSQENVLFFIGEPEQDTHPIKYQAAWLSEKKGGSVPKDVMDSIQKLHGLALKHNVSFEELCFYAVNVANGKLPNDDKKFTKIIEEM